MFLDKRSSGPLAQLVEQLTFNQWVTGSNPVRLTTNTKSLAELLVRLLFVRFKIKQPNLNRFVENNWFILDKT